MSVEDISGAELRGALWPAYRGIPAGWRRSGRLLNRHQFLAGQPSRKATITIWGERTATEDEPALSDQIGELTSEQAQQAVVNLYDELPDELWLNQSKWDLEDFPVRAEQLEFSSPTSLRPALQEAMGPGNDELKGELAKIVLVEFASLDETSEYVRSAVQAARRDRYPAPTVWLRYLAALAGGLRSMR